MKKESIIPFAFLTIMAACMVMPGWSRSHRGNFSNGADSYYGDRIPTDDTPVHDDTTGLSALSLAPPARYKNLEICLIYGTAGTDRRKYTVLRDALREKKVRVRETSEVNELRIDNNSDDYIYINSGDIVKGGKQDRTIQYDVIIPPRKQNLDLASFCVEHGRWAGRGNESTTHFEASDRALSSKELKIAAKHAKNQQQVWAKVAKYQDKASENLSRTGTGAVSVKSRVSQSSLQLTLDHEAIRKSNAAYRKAILDQLRYRQGAVGLAYFVNGKLYGIDVYNNHQLFGDLFDKLLDAVIAEAVSENDGRTLTPADPAEVERVLKAAARISEQTDVNELTRFSSGDTPADGNLVIFTTTDRQLRQWLHRNWLDKTES